MAHPVCWTQHVMEFFSYLCQVSLHTAITKEFCNFHHKLDSKYPYTIVTHTKIATKQVWLLNPKQLRSGGTTHISLAYTFARLQTWAELLKIFKCVRNTICLLLCGS